MESCGHSEFSQLRSRRREEKKIGSRKFLVWLTWLVIAVIELAVTIICLIVTKTIPDSMIELMETGLSYLFFISLTYLGVNLGQKIGLAYAGKETKEEKTEGTND